MDFSVIEMAAAEPVRPSARAEFLPNLQILRFVAATMVVIEHLQFKTRVFGFMAHGWLVDFKPVYFPVGVDIFLVISGFIMFHLSGERFAQPGYWRVFLLRRVIRIVPLYWLFTGLTLLAMVDFGGDMNHTIFNPAHIIASFVFVPWPRFDGEAAPILSVGWTLNYEMLFYAMFAAALVFRRRLGTALVMATILILVALHTAIPNTWWAATFWTSPILLDFLLGVVLALLYDRGFRVSRLGGALILSVGVAYLVVSNHFDAPHHIGRFLSLGIPAALVCAALVFAPTPARPGIVYRAAIDVGNASYALYLSHAFTLSLLAIGCHRLGIRNPYLFFSAALIASVVIAWLIYQQLETRLTARLNGFAAPFLKPVVALGRAPRVAVATERGAVDGPTVPG